MPVTSRPVGGHDEAAAARTAINPPIAMIATMNDCTFSVLPVMNRLSATPAITAGIVPMTMSAIVSD